MDDSNNHIIANKSLEEALKPPSNTRLANNRFVGQAVGAGKLGDIVSGNPASTNLGSGTASALTTVANATSGSFLFTLTDTYNRVILAVPDVAIYIDSVSAANQWPNAFYGMGNMPITVFNDWGQTNNINVVTRIVIRNNSGGDVNVIVVVRMRIITNSTAALSGLTDPGASQ